MSGGNSSVLSGSISQFGAVATLAIENDKVFEEITFSISKRIAIGASATVDIIIDPTACTCKELVVLPVKFKALGAGPINIDIYLDPVYSGGDEIESINRYFKSTRIAEAKWWLNPTITNPGTKLPPEFVILSDGVSAVAAAGGESSENEVTAIDVANKYLFRLENQDNTDVLGASVSSTWFEVV